MTGVCSSGCWSTVYGVTCMLSSARRFFRYQREPCTGSYARVGLAKVAALVDLMNRLSRSLVLHKGNQFIIDPVCLAGGHLCNDLHAVGLFRSVKGELVYTLQRQDDAH
jgi:hypothetical protein